MILPTPTASCNSEGKMMEEKEEVTQFVRSDPPSHYSLKIESFSLLAKHPVNQFESREFAVGGYEWKLLLRPNGGHNHISLYLAIANPTSLPHGWQIKVVCRFFVFDIIRDNYLTIGDSPGRSRQFHDSETKWGFSKLMSLDTFQDPANGFLVDDACEFGVEVFTIRSRSDHMEPPSLPDTVIAKTYGCRNPSLNFLKKKSLKHMIWPWHQKKMTAAVISKFVRQDPPHYSFKLESPSEFATKEYKSSDFVVGGYKWNLLLKSGDGNDHISLYLAMADANSLPHDWEVKVLYRFFVFDQIRDNYLTIGDSAGTVRRFHSLKTKWGFSQLMSLTTFKDHVNGFLVNNACEFGVEIFTLQRTFDIESLSLKKSTFKHEWVIEKFSEIKEDHIQSDVFIAGGLEWHVELFPRGVDSTLNSLSLCLRLDSSNKVYANFLFTLTSPRNGKQISSHFYGWFSKNSGCGWPINLNEFRDSYLVNDRVTLETNITAYGCIKHSDSEKHAHALEVEGEELRLICPICMDKMKQVTSTECGHVFCKSCITKAIRIHNKCPTCRRMILSTDNTLQIYLPCS